jgi:hypothetical protein
MALPRHLKVQRVVADDPVVGQHSGVLELQRLIERGPARRPSMKVLGRRRRLREADVVVGQIDRLQERIRRRRIRDPNRRNFFTGRS